jgi:periplasmic protein TonB
MSARKETFLYNRPRLSGMARLAVAAALLCAIAACKKEEVAAPVAADAAVSGPATQASDAVSAAVAALSPEELRDRARTAYAESRLYAPAGDNAMEYYLALRDKQPGDAGVSSALTDLMPMAVIATEQSRDRGDFAEAQRLYALIEKADAQHPALERLKRTIVAAQESADERAKQQALTAEQEAARQKQLEQDRERQQQQQQQQAAAQLASQEQADQRAAAQRAAEQRAAEQRAAEQRAAEQRAAQPATPTPQPAAPASTAARPAASTELRALSTPAPNYPPDALRAGQSGEVQVEFTVNPDGSVSNARVVRSNPPRVFDREAVAAVRRWRFEPVAAPVTTRRTIGFSPGN